MIFCKHALTVLLSLALLNAQSQDSLRITLDEADKLFLQKNLLMIAGSLNVDAQKALEVQAKLYPNPDITIGVNAFDADNKKLFYAGRSGEKTFEFNQLVLLGGKRKNQIELARSNTAYARLQLEDLMRTLKLQLHNNLFALYFDLLTLNKFNLQLEQLDTIIVAYEEQSQKGNIPLKEVVRLKSVYIRLNNDKTELLTAIRKEQQDLQVLLGGNRFIVPQLDALFWRQFVRLPSIDSLQTTAMQQRSDIKISKLGIDLSSLNEKYQRSLAVPDLTVGTAYDQRGGAFNNQLQFNVGIPLPLWNRNQGNIKYAQTQTSISLVNHKQQEQEVLSEVNAAWFNMQRSIQEYEKIRESYVNGFTEVYEGMRTNFLKRNISIVEFVDFFESYNESIAEVNRIRKQLALSAENINYSVGYPIY